MILEPMLENISGFIYYFFVNNILAHIPVSDKQQVLSAKFTLFELE